MEKSKSNTTKATKGIVKLKKVTSHRIKAVKVEALGHWSKGLRTSAAVMDQIPGDVWDYMPAWLIAKVGDAINAAHNATSPLDAEYIDCLKDKIAELENTIYTNRIGYDENGQPIALIKNDAPSEFVADKISGNQHLPFADGSFVVWEGK